MTNSKVIFIPVKDNQAKCQALVVIAQRYFSTGTRLIFSVASDEIASYVDQLLWKFPTESFLPHAILSHSSAELIVITTLLENLNQAPVLFNLRPEANPLAVQLAITYEFMDYSHPEKLEQSNRRREIYLQQGLQVS